MKASSRRPDAGAMVVRIWGCRGSLPSPGPETAHFGGNTSCIEVRCGGEVLILDSGSGIRELGNSLLRNGPVRASILYSHYHWDHIMGLPFFVPGYVPGNSFRIYGERKDSLGLREVLSGQMQAPYFPVPMGTMKAGMEFVEIGPDMALEIGGAVVKTFRANHPNGCLSYRIECDGSTVVYATDTEHSDTMDPNMVRAAENADLFFYDATYTDREYNGNGGSSKKGWGHSTWEEAVKIARAAGVKRLILWHHDPSHTDADVHRIEKDARKAFKGCRAARDGLTFTL